MTSPSPKERLEEILNQLYIDGTNHGKTHTFVYAPQKHALVSILSLFESILPDEKHSKFHDALSERQEMRCDGWNYYRTELLKRLESMK